MSGWAHIKADYDEKAGFKLEDDIVNCVCVDAYLTANDNEPGNVIAKVIKTRKGDVGVVYIDSIAIKDDYAQGVIKEVIAEMRCDDFSVRCDDFSVKYSPAVGELLTVVFQDGSRREIETVAGDALRCWEREFYVNADRIREAWIDDKSDRRSWLCGGPDEIRPTEKVRIINNRHVYIGGTWYEIAAPGGGGVEHYGDCEPEMTPRQVYNHYFPRPVGDGVKHTNVTLFFIDSTDTAVIHMTDRTVSLDVFDYNSEAMDKWRDLIPCGNDRRREGYMLTYEPYKLCSRPFIWPERPRIILVEGGHVTLPWWVLYKNGENDFIPKYHRPNEKMEAIGLYLIHAGIKWSWM